MLGDIAPEGFQQVERMAVGQPAGLQGGVQRVAFGAGAGLTARSRLQPIELGKFLPGIGRRVVGDIIRRAREAMG